MMDILPFSTRATLVILSSFVVYRVFKRFEPDKLTPLSILLLVVPSTLVLVVPADAPSFSLATGIIFLSYYSLILLCVIIYRLSPVHPLAHYPGPFPNKISKLWVSYIASTGKLHVYYRKLHDQYGDIVRVGPNELSVNRADAVQPVLVTPGTSKGPWWYNRVREGQVDGLIGQRDPIEHRRRRKPWDRSFSSAGLKNYEEIVIRRSRELIEQFERRDGEEIDLSMWMSCFSFDFMGDMTFGAGFNFMQDGGDVKGVWKAIEGNVEMDGVMGHVPWAYSLLRLIPGANARRKRLFTLVAGWVRRRIEHGSTTKDLYYHLTDEEGLEPVKPSIPVAASDGVLAVIAGSDTVATALTALWYYLLRDPPTFVRLRNEVKSYFPHGEEPLDFSKMANMPYLNGCINEALRLLPPVVSGIQRSTLQGKLVGPYFIPEGNHISVHTYSIHRNPLYFSPLPDSFWPDRWLPEGDRQNPPSQDTQEFIHDPTAFIPFSMGAAGCVGKNLALLELRGFVCFVVQKFSFRFREGWKPESWEEDVEDRFVVKRPPLPVIVEVLGGGGGSGNGA